MESIEPKELERFEQLLAGLEEALAGLKELEKPKPMLNEKETADLLGVKSQTLAIWRSRGVGPDYCRLEQRRVMYRREDIDRYISEQTVRH